MADIPRILCIDDDPEILELLVEVLEEAGFIMEIATDGLAGLAQAREKPDLILCHISMPGLTGLELLEKLRDEGPILQDIPFVFLTAHGSQEHQTQACQLRCEGYVTKPVDFEHLIEIIHHHFRRT